MIGKLDANVTTAVHTKRLVDVFGEPIEKRVGNQLGKEKREREFNDTLNQ